ncbi:FAD-binding and (Fe-S)-binding domain-containing protein [Candidatus Riflebacteria bacterium]
MINKLKARFGEKIIIHETTLKAYSIDASIYRLKPAAVTFIEDPASLLELASYCYKNGIAMTPRTAGTNLCGNALGDSIILDFSRMRNIKPVESGTVRVEPGMVYADLIEELKNDGYFYGPDPSSGWACRLGGMIANNSSGAHTLKYGAVKDKLKSLRIVLPPFEKIYTLEENSKEQTLKRVKTGEYPDFLLEILHLLEKEKDEILAAQIPVSKNSSGYNLFSLARGMQKNSIPWHLLFVGSEGTLGHVVEAELVLDKIPPFIKTYLVYFKSLADLAKAVNDLRPLNPSAMEMLDSYTMDLIGRDKYCIPATASTMLILELDSGEHDSLDRKVAEILKKYTLPVPFVVAEEKEAREALWRARNAIFPTLYAYSRELKPLNFVDDVVVAAKNIPALVEYIQDTFIAEGIKVAIYGHIGDGNAHINPLMSLKKDMDFTLFKKLSEKIHKKVIEDLNGSICGEHGDGRVRGHYIKDLYGEKIYGLFKTVKKLIDPKNLLNPGVKFDPVGFTEFIDVVRVSGDCATCGKCNAVCPVYDATGDESMSARGWWHILNNPDFNIKSDEKAWKSCINCKSCRTACPVSLDVSEKIMQLRNEHPIKSFYLPFWFLSRPYMHKLLTMFAPLQFLLKNSHFREILEKSSAFLLREMGPNAKISKDLVLPRIADKSLRERYPELTGSFKNRAESVAYFHGCAANIFNDSVGDDVVKIFNLLGEKIKMPPQVCSGSPMEGYGYLDMKRKNALYNIQHFHGFGAIVTGCASCTLSLSDYPKLFTRGTALHKKAVEFSNRVFHIGHYLMTYHNNRFKFESAKIFNGNITYHSSCHLRTSGQAESVEKILANVKNYIPMRDYDRCAGGAGTFNVKDFNLSMQIFKRKKKAALRSGAKFVFTSCPACMIQLKTGLNNGNVRILHLCHLLKELLE